MISVIVPTVNRPGPLHRALRSLSRQTLRDFEVIVVNDGGRSPAPVVDAWKGQLDVTLLEVEVTSGAAHARNVALARAVGAHVAFLDDDDIYLPWHLQRAAIALRDGPADVVYGGAVISSRWIEAMPRSAETLPRKDYDFDGRFLEVANLIHTGSVVARNFSHTEVRFDERLSHCEDWDLWLALRRGLDYRFSFLGSCTSVYHQVPHRPGLVADGYRTTPSAFTRARTTVYDKWPPTDHSVARYRDWFRSFDRRLDVLIGGGEAVPSHVFEHAVRATYAGFTRGVEADERWLDAVFPTRDDTTLVAGLALNG